MFRTLKLVALFTGWLNVVAGFSSASLGQDEKVIPLMFPELIRVVEEQGLVEELNLLPDQKRKIQAILKEHYREVDSRLTEVRTEQMMAKLHGIETAKELLAKAEREIKIAANRQMIEQLSEVLLPHQMERLNQLAMHRLVNGYQGFVQGIASLEGTGLIDFQPGEIQRIEDESKERQAEFEEKMFQLRQKYRQQLLEELTEQQRERMEELRGKPSKVGLFKLKF